MLHPPLIQGSEMTGTIGQQTVVKLLFYVRIDYCEFV